MDRLEAATRGSSRVDTATGESARVDRVETATRVSSLFPGRTLHTRLSVHSEMRSVNGQAHACASAGGGLTLSRGVRVVDEHAVSHSHSVSHTFAKAWPLRVPVKHRHFIH